MTKSRANYRFQIILPARLYDKLFRESKDSGVPMAELIRRALDARKEKKEAV